MDLNRSSHINRTDEVVATEVLPNPTDKQIHPPSESGELVKFFNGASVNCAAPEIIHTSPLPVTIGFGNSWGWGFCKTYKIF